MNSLRFTEVKINLIKLNFAVRIFEKSLLRLSSYRIALPKELEIARQVDHPTLVLYYGSLVFHLIRQLLVALEYMHDLCVIHKDIKPQKDGQYLYPNCGTPGYCAPELLQNKLCHFKVDIYSTNVVLFKMQTGQKPFESEDQYIRVKLNKQDLNQQECSKYKLRGFGFPIKFSFQKSLTLANNLLGCKSQIISNHQFEFDELDNLILEQSKKQRSSQQSYF